MKKTIAVIMTAVLSALMLCSCKALDDAKYNHGIYLDETKEALEFRGNAYTKILSGVESPEGAVFGNGQVSFLQKNMYDDAYITDKAVPVLLKGSFGDHVSYLCGEPDSPLIIAIYDPSLQNDSSCRYYCREDKVDSVGETLKNPEIDHYFLRLGAWDEGENHFTEHYELMDDQITDLIHDCLSRVYSEATDYPDFSLIPDVASEYLSLQSCDKDLLLTDETEVQIIRTTGKDRKYYVAFSGADDDKSYNYNGALSETSWYQLPAQDAGYLDELFEKYPENLESFYFEDPEESAY